MEQWKRYKRSTGLKGDNIVDHLWYLAFKWATGLLSYSTDLLGYQVSFSTELLGYQVNYWATRLSSNCIFWGAVKFFTAERKLFARISCSEQSCGKNLCLKNVRNFPQTLLFGSCSKLDCCTQVWDLRSRTKFLSRVSN